MNGIKFLFRSWFKWIGLVITPVVLCAGIVVVACVFNEEYGSEEYIMPKSWAQLGAEIMVMIAAIVTWANITGSRLMRSCPIAKKLYTRDVPLFILLLTLGTTIVINGVYLAVTRAGANEISDTLILAALHCALCIIVNTLFMHVQVGPLLGLYLVMFPEIGFTFVWGREVEAYGFGVPLWAAALIFVGAVAASAVIAFAASGVIFRRSNFKERPAAMVQQK